MRELERQIGAIARKVARGVAEEKPSKGSIGEAKARELLGRQRYHSETKRRTRLPGVATGLAWTPVGGDVLFVEATAMDGDGELHHHRPARRRHEGVRAGGDVLRARPSRARSRPTCRRTGSSITTSTSTSRPARSRRTGRQRGHHDGDRARVAAERPPRPRRRRDDRRDDADRAGPADRRPEGQGARRAAQRDLPDHRARAQRARHRRDPRAPAHRSSTSTSSGRSATFSSWRWSPRPSRSRCCRGARRPAGRNGDRVYARTKRSASDQR